MQSIHATEASSQPPSAPAFQRPAGSGGGNKKGTSAERRATHNAIERARRESLNGRFLQLAASLPAISDVRRPSKSLIVNKSLDFVADAMTRESIYRLKIDNMRQENMQLRQQLNKLLAQAGLETLPQPPIDELPVPLAEMGNKKRQGGMGASGQLVDVYDLDDDDGPSANGSEGEGGKNSPTSSCSAASSMRGSLSSSVPTGVAGFTPISQTGVYGQPPSFLSIPANPIATTTTSPGALSGSGDVGSVERSGSFDDAAGNWVQPGGNQQLTYAGLAFSSPSNNHGLITPSGADVNGGQQLASSMQMGLNGVGSVMGQGGHAQMYSMNANNYAQVRNVQQLQLQQQQQLQLQLQFQQQQQQQQQQYAINPSHFF
ncbi:conserved hypothetical protein [Sporisorium reilianum SRZ2]|uniref:BHLH domain-containing protein n=1 Tax=Sporisorium reilianum (strain SRZ2) TaxID=999809 RepID=E6ZSY7_SPORE|nr:conserved hypothetical protein [Sporisorium reilianum SRZ2]